MVQVASLRIQIDATQAAQSAAQLRRELDGVAVSSRGVASQAAPVAATLGKTAQAAVTTGREFDKMGIKLGKVSDLFGSLGRRSLVFLGADVLARAAGFNSILDVMGKGLDAVGKALRTAVVGPVSFQQAIDNAANASTLSLDALIEKLGQTKAVAEGSQKVKFGGVMGKWGSTGTLNFGGIDFSNPEAAQRVADIVTSLQKQLNTPNLPGGLDTAGKFAGAQLAVDGLADQYARAANVTRRAAIEQKAWNDELARFRSMASSIDTRAGVAAGYGPGVMGGAMGLGINAAKAHIGTYGTGTPGSYASLGMPIPYDPDERYQPGAKPGSYAASGGSNFASSLASIGGYVGAYTAQLKLAYDAQERLRKSGEEFGNAVGSAFENAVFMTGTLRERLSALFQDITRAAFSQLVTKNVSGAIAGMFAADGAAFGPSGVIPFAYGGIVSSPTMFGFGGNKTGLMGEAGPEAVMPLKRGADGKLGVQGGGGGNTINQYITIKTPDVAGFGRSQRQVAAQLRGMMG